jgi:hypothetical protein
MHIYPASQSEEERIEWLSKTSPELALSPTSTHSVDGDYAGGSVTLMPELTIKVGNGDAFKCSITFKTACCLCAFSHLMPELTIKVGNDNAYKCSHHVHNLLWQCAL